MSHPLVFISHNRIKDGKLEELRQFYAETIDQLKQDKPGTVMHLGFASEDGTTMSFIHAFPDGEAIIAHMAGVDQRVSRAYELIETLQYELYGPIPDEVLEAFRRYATGDIELVIEPDPLGGYMRLARG